MLLTQEGTTIASLGHPDKRINTHYVPQVFTWLKTLFSNQLNILP